MVVVAGGCGDVDGVWPAVEAAVDEGDAQPGISRMWLHRLQAPRRWCRTQVSTTGSTACQRADVSQTTDVGVAPAAVPEPESGDRNARLLPDRGTNVRLDLRRGRKNESRRTSQGKAL